MSEINPNKKTTYTFDVDGFSMSGTIELLSDNEISFHAFAPHERFSFIATLPSICDSDEPNQLNDMQIEFVRNYLNQRMLYAKAASNSQIDMHLWW